MVQIRLSTKTWQMANDFIVVVLLVAKCVQGYLAEPLKFGECLQISEGA